MDNSYIEIGYKITDKDGNSPTIAAADANAAAAARGADGKTEYVAPINYASQSMFSNVDMYLNDTLINLSGGFHHYKEYLKVLLSYNNDYKNTVLRPYGWAADKPRFLNSVSNSNAGFWTRLGAIAEVDAHKHQIIKYNPDGGVLFGNLGVDFKGMPLINGINIRLQYTLNPADVFLFGRIRAIQEEKIVDLPLKKKYIYTLNKFVLHMLVHELTPSLYETIEHRLKTEPLIAGFKRYNMLQHSIPAGLTEWLSDTLLPS